MKKQLSILLLLLVTSKSTSYSMDDPQEWVMATLQKPNARPQAKAVARKLYAIKKLTEFSTNCRALAAVPQLGSTEFSFILSVPMVLSRLFDGALAQHFANDSEKLSALANAASPAETNDAETNDALQKYMHTFLIEKANALNNVFDDLSERTITQEDLLELCLLNSTVEPLLPSQTDWD
jgi:hypothetical protein